MIYKFYYVTFFKKVTLKSAKGEKNGKYPGLSYGLRRRRLVYPGFLEVYQARLLLRMFGKDM
jgi:hypothetical protein